MYFVIFVRNILSCNSDVVVARTSRFRRARADRQPKSVRRLHVRVGKAQGQRDGLGAHRLRRAVVGRTAAEEIRRPGLAETRAQVFPRRREVRNTNLT